MVAPATLRQLTKMIEALEQRINAPGRVVSIFGENRDEADIEQEVKARLASGEIGPNDDILIIGWMTKEESPEWMH
jgi:hypothetical protein